MKLLVLSIFNETQAYKRMLEAQTRYISNLIINTDLISIEYYFVKYGTDDQSENVVIDGNMISIKPSTNNRSESFLGLTYKTTKTLEYFIITLNKSYDYVIRTNISTLINYQQLYITLNSLPSTNVYTGGKLECLKWIIDEYGVTHKTTSKYRLDGLNYIQGIGIIWSGDVAKQLAIDIDKINESIIDDVTFGLYIRDNYPEIYNNIQKYCKATVSYGFSKEATFNRIKSDDRISDVIYMNKFIDLLLSY